MLYPSKNLSYIEIHYDDAMESIESICAVLYEHPKRAELVKSLSLMDDDVVGSDRGFPTSKNILTPTLLRLIPSLNDLSMDGMHFGVMPDFQAFCATLRDATQVNEISLTGSYISLDELLGVIHAAGLATRKGTMILGDLHISDLETHLRAMNVSYFGWELQDPPVFHGLQVATTDRDYRALNDWILELDIKNPCDHLFLDILPSSGLPLHTLGTLSLQVSFLSANLVTRINNIISYMPSLNVLKVDLDFDRLQVSRGLGEVTVPLQIPYNLHRLEISLGQVKHRSSPAMISWWGRTFTQDNVPPISELRLTAELPDALDFLFHDLITSRRWHRLDEALSQSSIGRIAVPACEDKYQGASAKQFYEHALPKTVERFVICGEGSKGMEGMDVEDLYGVNRS